MDFSKQFVFSSEIAKEAGLIPAIVLEALRFDMFGFTCDPSKSDFIDGAFFADLDIGFVLRVMPFLTEYDVVQSFRRLELLDYITVKSRGNKKKFTFGSRMLMHYPDDFHIAHTWIDNP